MSFLRRRLIWKSEVPKNTMELFWSGIHSVQKDKSKMDPRLRGEDDYFFVIINL